MINIDKKFIKVYDIKNLLDDNTIERTNAINNFDTKSYKALVDTSIVIENLKVIYTQPMLTVTKRTEFNKSDFKPLVEALTYFENIGFVHGDLNRKNIIWTNDGFKIIDYEPSIIQLVDNNELLMVTIPYVLDFELNNKKITNKTDKLSFFYFVLRMNKILKSIHVVNLSKNLDHNKFLSFRYQKIIKMDYNQILDYAYNFILNEHTFNLL